MKNKSIIAVITLFTFLQFSCYKDKTTLGNNPISDIKIEFPNVQSDVVNIDKNELLTINPVITQTISNEPLTYDWEIDYKSISTDKDFHYTGEQLGSFVVRLKVSNKDGSTYKSFTLNVNSPYEEGVMVLGEKDNGEGTLSFMRKYTPEEIAAGKTEHFDTGLFGLNNPGMSIGKGPSDIAKRANQIFISSADDGRISVINGKTFELEALITASDLPNFKPYRLNVPDNTSTSGIILNKDGKLFTLASKEFLVLPNTKLTDKVPDANLALKTYFVATMNFTHNYFWDNTHSTIWDLWYTNTNSKDVLAGEDMIQFFPAGGLVYTLTKDKNDPSKLTKTVFGQYIQEYFKDPVDLKEQREFTNAAPSLTDQSITLVNEKYVKLVYANDRSVYNWFYTGIDIPTAPFITIDIPGTITCMASDPTGDVLYLGVYDAAASGLKGSVLAYNMDNGQLIKKYEGVSDKPVKIFYKKKI